MGLTLGIDACRIRSGGAIAHLVGILTEGDPSAHGIGRVHLWSYRALLDAVPDVPWLAKHNPPELERSLVHQLWWQFRSLPREAKKSECDLLFAPDASTVCGFRPSVAMSQDMLSYEPGQMGYYGLSMKRLRLIVIRMVQNRAMRNAAGVIFLTNYAAKVIQQATGKLDRVSIVPHGIGAEFRQTTSGGEWPDTPGREIRCVYVSNAAMYKHQWVVVRAIGQLRKRGHNVRLLLVGGGAGRARRLMDEAIAETDPRGEFIQCKEFVPHDAIPGLLATADVFVFASSCENLPVTLLEAMAGSLPIVCSDRGPMPEVLRDGGVYFDPTSYASVSAAIEKIIVNRQLRVSVARRAKELSQQYSWANCANDTWRFLRATVCKEENASCQAGPLSVDGSLVPRGRES
jgi:glycosyltransferase involved in cell wall biosynthesis